MKKLIYLCVAVMLLAGCGVSDAPDVEPLLGRARAFGNLLVSIDGMGEAEAKQELSKYIEPSSSRDERIATYYREFCATAKTLLIVTQSVESATIDDDGVNASVKYKMIARSRTNARTVPIAQVTQWKYIDGKWFRTISKPKKSLDK